MEQARGGDTPHCRSVFRRVVAISSSTTLNGSQLSHHSLNPIKSKMPDLSDENDVCVRGDGAQLVRAVCLNR